MGTGHQAEAKDEIDSIAVLKNDEAKTSASGSHMDRDPNHGGYVQSNSSSSSHLCSASGKRIVKSCQVRFNTSDLTSGIRMYTAYGIYRNALSIMRPLLPAAPGPKSYHLPASTEWWEKNSPRQIARLSRRKKNNLQNTEHVILYGTSPLRCLHFHHKAMNTAPWACRCTQAFFTGASC